MDECKPLDVGKGLLEDGAKLAIFDPKVSDEQIAYDMKGHTDNITTFKTAKEALDGAHAVCIMTEWDEFKMYDWKAGPGCAGPKP